VVHVPTPEQEDGRHLQREIVALARKLVIALWRYADFGEIPQGALLKSPA